VFFRKKSKYTDVEGYNRISRLIEDRQREISQGMPEDDDFDDDSILLNHEAPGRERTIASFTDDAEAVSSVRPIAPPAPEQPSPDISLAPPEPGLTERRIPFQMTPPPAVTAAAAPPPVREAVPAPTMSVPDFGASPMGGSLVAAEAVWEGKLITNGQLRVEGTLHGDVQTPSSVFVAANAHLDGTIRAGSLVVAGEVEGKVECSERLEVLPGGSARGEIQTAALVVHEGAFIDSRFQMTKAGVSPAD
jgi:cytoskeletal protein CcmA (bactofilin family)